MAVVDPSPPPITGTRRRITEWPTAANRDLSVISAHRHPGSRSTKSPLRYYSHPFPFTLFYHLLSLGCVGSVSGGTVSIARAASVPRSRTTTPTVPLTEREDSQESYGVHVAWDLESLVVASVITRRGEFNSFTLKLLPPLSLTLRPSAVNHTRSGRGWLEGTRSCSDLKPAIKSS